MSDHSQQEAGGTVSIAEVFENAFPWYLSIGMTADQFWKGPPSWAAAYRKAEQYRQQRQNFEAWRMGLYVQSALQATVGNFALKKGAKPFEYLKEPLPIDEKEANARKARDAKLAEESFKEQLKAWAASNKGKPTLDEIRKREEAKMHGR